MEWLAGAPRQRCRLLYLLGVFHSLFKSNAPRLVKAYCDSSLCSEGEEEDTQEGGRPDVFLRRTDRKGSGREEASIVKGGPLQVIIQ